MNTLCDLLRTAANKYPDRPAVLDPERGESLSYEELELRANSLREALFRQGFSLGDRVGIYAPKSCGTVASIFGILNGGGAYVPVDVNAPPQRNVGIFEDCSVRYAVVGASVLEGLRAASRSVPFQILEDLGSQLLLVSGIDTSPTENSPSSEPSRDDLAYILYTSGSTGKPKGVVHTHGSALAFIDWCSETFLPTENDRFSSHAPFHFDLSIFDIYVPIKHGAAVVLIGEEVGKQPARLAPLIAEQKITIWYSTPSILRLLVEYGGLDKVDCSALRFVHFAGEVFPVKHLRALKKHWHWPRYFNLYGPTETNVCTYYEIPSTFPEDRTQPFPIGFTCSGDRALVVDENDRQVAPGEQGELLISGESVMRGYWNLPERTALAFFNDPAGVTWYRTGDVVSESSHDGYIFVGRRDRMVKRRGYRVELGEIEAALYRHPLVAEAAVISVPDEENGVLIKAFLTVSNGKTPSLVEMKRYCMEQLPSYMIPDRFKFPESLPKTSTDKIDYQRLRELA